MHILTFLTFFLMAIQSIVAPPPMRNTHSMYRGNGGKDAPVKHQPNNHKSQMHIHEQMHVIKMKHQQQFGAHSHMHQMKLKQLNQRKHHASSTGQGHHQEQQSHQSTLRKSSVVNSAKFVLQF